MIGVRSKLTNKWLSRPVPHASSSFSSFSSSSSSPSSSQDCCAERRITISNRFLDCESFIDAFVFFFFFCFIYLFIYLFVYLFIYLFIYYFFFLFFFFFLSISLSFSLLSLFSGETWMIFGRGLTDPCTLCLLDTPNSVTKELGFTTGSLPCSCASSLVALRFVVVVFLW